MKKHIIILGLLLNAAILRAGNNINLKDSLKSTNEIKDVKNIIKLNIGQVGNNGAVGLSYERMLNKNISASISIFGKYNSVNLGGSFSEKTAGLGFMPEIRYYAIPNYNAPRGLYLGAFYNYYSENFEKKSIYSSLDEESGNVTSTFTSVGATIGWMFRIKSSFVIDLSIGPAFESIDSPPFYDIKSGNGTFIRKDSSPNQSSTSLTGIFRFSIGYAF